MKDLLLVRRGPKFYIRVLDRQTGDFINEIPSICDHIDPFVKKHPRRTDCVLECCLTCQVIRGYNINTSETFTVYEGPEAIIICEGPTGSALVVGQQNGLFQLNWNEDESQEAKLIYRGIVPTQKINKEFLLFCYVEYHDVLICTCRDLFNGQDYEIIAAKLGNGSIMWRLLGPVDGQIIKPKSIACDSDDNVYVSDLATNRILQINVLTGMVLRILLLDEDEHSETIQSMRWSNIEPNLTVRTSKQISTYFVPK